MKFLFSINYIGIAADCNLETEEQAKDLAKLLFATFQGARVDLVIKEDEKVKEVFNLVPDKIVWPNI